jgi:hypothetical protein
VKQIIAPAYFLFSRQNRQNIMAHDFYFREISKSENQKFEKYKILHFYVVQVPGKHQIPFKQKETYLKTKEFQ